MKKIEIKIRERYGRLTILKEDGFYIIPSSGARVRKVLCKCDCGKEVKVYLISLRNGKVKSCGCFKKEKATRHGLHGSNTYKKWDSMIQGCTNPNNNGFIYYGKKGIKVYPPWLVFAGFLKDMGECPKGMVLNRINKNNNYEPNNCEWGKKNSHTAWNKGKTFSIEYRKKLSDAHMGKLRGELSPNWIKDRTKIKTYKWRTNSNYKQWNKQCRERDGHSCKINNKDCDGRLEVHHILPARDYPELRYDNNNGITLCFSHHPKKGKEAELSPYFKELIKEF